MKTKFIIILVTEGIIILFLLVFALYQQTEVRRQELLAIDLARQAQVLQEQLNESRLMHQHALAEAVKQRQMCEELQNTSRNLK